MTLHAFVTHKINRFVVAATTLVTAGVIAFGGLTAVGAQATGTYQCGTYGGGDYNQTDCTDPVVTTPTPTPTTTTQPSTGSGTTKNSSGTSSPSTSTGNSGTTGSSTSTGSTTTTTETPAPAGSILLNAFSEYRTSAGKSLTFALNDKFYFNLKGEQHTITVKSISSTELIVTIASTPVDVTVPVGQTVNHDTDGDGTDDIAVTYTAASGNVTDGVKGTASFRALAASTNDVTTQSGSTGATSTGATTETQRMWWIFVIPIVLGLAIIAAVVIVIMKRRKANAGGGNFSQF